MQPTTKSKQSKRGQDAATNAKRATRKLATGATSGTVVASTSGGQLTTMRVVPYRAGTATVAKLIGQAREGVPAQELRETGQQLELAVRELAVLLGTTERTLARRFRLSDTLNKAESERLLLLQRLVAHGVDVFEDQGKFNRWLRRPLPLLADQSPLQLLDTASGFQVVDELLGRIEYGVYS